jgi:UDPglucose 6-dehydrogenase
MRIGIFGTGYVGLITGACFAEMGNHVTCVDVDEEKIAKLNQGHSPIYEPGLEELLAKNLKKQYLSFTSDAKEAIEQSELLFIAVGTPSDQDGSADLKYVLKVAETIGENLSDYKVVVNKSTVPVGTCDKVRQKIQEVQDRLNRHVSFDVVSNPEFLKEGAAISDCMKPDRIIIGTDSEKAETLMRELYQPFNRNNERVMVMDPRSAELTKYVSNAMLATKISFMNEMSQIAERVGADIDKVRIGIGSDSRIGPHFIYPGCGYGGSCFPKDIRALNKMAEQVSYKAELLASVDRVNSNQKKVLFNKLLDFYHGDLQDKTICVWGLAFKPNTDDIREASSRVLVEALWERGARVQAYDPEAADNFQEAYGIREDYRLYDSAYEALNNSDALCVLTEWMEFRSPDFNLIRARVKDKVIFDGRNLYHPKNLSENDLQYFAIGRGK